jgi:aminoglycoside phosphotransferase
VKSSSPLPSPLRLPPPVRAAAQAAVGGRELKGELAWLSWAGTVWRLEGDSGTVFVKRAAKLTGERDRVAWLTGRWPVPEIVGLFNAAGDDWLITREVPGVPMYHSSVGWEPRRVARELGLVLRGLHATDATDCPFGSSKPGNVLIHGDYCLPNVLVHEGRLSGVVDLGQSGLGDPRDDLGAGLWTLQYNYGRGFARDFLEAYGWPAMSDQDIERLRRRYAR